MRLTYLGHLGRSLPYNGSPINVPDVQIPNMTAQLQRPYQPWGGINVTKSTGSDNFNSAQIEVNKRFSHGVSFQAQYSYNRGLDNVAYAGGPQRPLHPELDYGNSTGQPRQWLVFNYVYELPFGKGRQFLNSSGKFVNQVLGGWQLAGISTYGGGVPNSVTFAVPASVTGWWGGRADRVSGVSLYEGRKKSHDIKNGVPWFNTNAFAPPAKWQWGNSARDLLFAPGMWNWDMSGSKTFGTPWERMHVEFRGDFFDAFNHFNLGAPTYAIADTRDGGAANANSGKITGGSGQRSIQLNLNLKF